MQTFSESTPATRRQSLPAFALQRATNWLRHRLLWWGALPCAALLAVIAVTNASPSTPTIELMADPPFAATGGDKPAMTLALSVEFPTVGAQYVSDGTYDTNKEYLGYYDAEACYRYNDAPTETPGTGQTTADFKRFDRVGKAIALATPDAANPYKTSRMCDDAFSGNFLNWATSSAIDMLRLALSGGDRYIDTAELTTLQRAVLPNGDPICMWNSSNFPARQLPKDGGGTGKYWGAVPNAMITAANGNAIWIANTLNRIYFKAGSSSSGSCGSTGDYTLGATSSTGNVMGSIESRSTGRPTGTWTTCMNGESGSCSFSGTKEIWYGQVGRSNWKVVPAYNGFSCGSSCNNTLGDPDSGYSKAVYYRDYTGSWTPPATPAGQLNSDGFFYSRAQVCNVDSAGNLLDVRDYGLCRLYPNGKYKPTGVIQKYSDQLRLAAFGYLLDQTASYNSGRYGGVLRAPMKYVGTKTFDENGIDNTPATGNPTLEWSATTGVFAANPDNHTKGISGVINYLNKFGRTGTPGLYKKYDPVGEMYYQAIRYLQGLQPSTDAVSGLPNTTLEDGFPVYTTWTDPFGGSRTKTSSYACLKNNVVVIGDINTHDSDSRVPSANTANNIPDIKYWRGIVQAFEKNSGTTYLDGAGASRTATNPNGANNNVPSNGQTSQIMGTAYWAHTHDIRGSGWTAEPDKQRPGLRVKTFIFDVNENGTESDASKRRYANQFFMASKYGGFESDPGNRDNAPYNTWGSPFKREDGTNDNNVWQKADEAGEAGTYYLQSSARGVLNAFDQIFSRATTAARSIAPRAITKSYLFGESGLYFEAFYDTLDWSGDLRAFPISATDGSLNLDVTATWSAAAKLTARNQATTPRNIIVGHSGAAANPKASAFTWAAISAAANADVRTALNKPAPDAADDNLAQQRVAYLRGDTSLDGTTFRQRNNKLLGDIINSGVAYSGTPSRLISGTGYSSFASNHAARVGTVFVGANDGMLHAFKADDGSELFAYIPSFIVPQLPRLTSKTYLSEHRAFVDATPVVGEADLGSSTTPDWRTVLISGAGGGGKGVFALDITDPTAFTTSKVLWEFTASDDADLGHVIGTPRILKIRTSAPGATAVFKWFAVVPGGVNGTNPSLFLLDLAKPVGTAWVLGSNYYKVTLPVDATLKTTLASGVVQFSAEIGTGGEVVRMYAGDLHGRMWRLDFKQAGTADWNMAKLSAFSTSYDDALPNGDPLPLFIATDSNGKVQPITMAPSILYGGSDATNIIAFGTGKLLETGDKTDSSQQSFYALYDDIATPAQAKDTSSASSAMIVGRSRLKPGTVNTSTKVVSVDTFKWGRRKDKDVTDNTAVYSGWVFDFPDNGEREIYDAVVNGTNLQFNTLFPLTTNAATCGNEGGRSNSYTIDILTGDGGYRAHPEALSEPNIVIINVEYATQDGYRKGMTTRSTGRGVRKITTAEVATGQTSDQSVVIGRLNWRRINNYDDLR